MKPEKIHHYDIHESLGSGKQGTVYLATDTKLKRPVVLKIVHEDRAFRKTVRLEILEEARMASAIQHPNVCAIYEVSEYEQRPYMVMEYVTGQTLQELMEAEEEPIGLQFALSIAIQIGEGLGEAHRMGILHRDLRPANIKITKGGLVKILDFGLARRRSTNEEEALQDEKQKKARDYNAGGEGRDEPFGAVGYMAPEQFVTHRSTEQSDIFALGVMLYQMVTGRYPFWIPDFMGENELIRKIKAADPVPPQQLNEEVPDSLSEIILKAMDKQPTNRYESVSEFNEALKALMKSMDFELGTVPGESSAVLPTPDTESRKASAEGGNGLFSKLTEFFRQSGEYEAPSNSIAVLPFEQAEEGTGQQKKYFGLALADAIANRLIQQSSVQVRSPGVFLSLKGRDIDELQTRQRLDSEYVLRGSYFSSEHGFVLNWQLLGVADKSIQTGGTIEVDSQDLVKVQGQVTEEVVQALFNLGKLDLEITPAAAAPREVSLPDAISEQYLEARALLSRFLWGSNNPKDLEESRQQFERVLEEAPDYAPAQAGLGRAHLNYVVNGFGGHVHFMAAQRHLEKALRLDPTNVEAKLQRSYTYLWRGEKEQARKDIQQLLKKAGDSPEVSEIYMISGIIFQLDGLYKAALRLFSMTLQHSPTAAPQVYNRRARIYHYMGEIEMAREEVRKGLTLEPGHPHLRTTEGYLHFRTGQYQKGIEVLESVIRDEPSRRMTYPTLAMCYVRAGQPEKADELINDELLAISATDCEMAYRLATYCVVDDNYSEALHWLRKTIYLGYENYPWIASNPVWEPLREDPEYRKIISDLKRVHERNKKRWEKFLSDTGIRESYNLKET